MTAERIHVLGVCGTFMAGIATLARELDLTVAGSDEGAYPPMSDLLAAQDIDVRPGYAARHLEPPPDLVIVGNALSRGNPAVEHVLNQHLDYTSAPAWLAEHVLRGRPVLAVAGTHGKTTTTAMLAWILEHAGRHPGFMVGGIPLDFDVSARLGKRTADGFGPFVVEADEYDSAFFDKRSKFVHYHPDVLIINNIEFDHADIFSSMEEIRRQFHHLLRTVPGSGLVIHPTGDEEVRRVLDMGCWTPVQTLGETAGDWRFELRAEDGSRFRIHAEGQPGIEVGWSLIGRHNVLNALAAVAAAHRVGVEVEAAAAALAEFKGIRRRLELRGTVDDIAVYDDFAHHPTAIRSTLDALRRRVGKRRIVAILEPASNTMRMGIHRDTLGPSLAEADCAWLYRGPNVTWDLEHVRETAPVAVHLRSTVETIVEEVADFARSGDQLLIMSNAGFGGLHARLLRALGKRFGE